MFTRLFAPMLVVAGLALAGWAYSPKPMSFESGAKLWFEGTSNLHGWSCEVEQFNGAVAGVVADGKLSGIASTTVTVPVSRIECGNGQMNRRMRDAIKASEHQNIQFTLTSARVGAPNNGRFAVETSGRLTLGGATRDISFVAEGHQLSDGRFRLTGSAPVTMSQFGISPPTAMLGTLRTGDEVSVRFDVTLR